MTITNFYSTMYVDASSYDNLRKIASVADGLKNSGRKVLNTILDKNIKTEVKVSRLKSTVSEYTEYLHGEDNLSSVIVNMARRFVGTNNLPLLREEGNFGKRFINEASADRYISTAGEKYLEYIFPKTDIGVLLKQEFEGNQIEPRFYVPIIPMILVNGSVNAISTGFAQNILPRQVNGIIKTVENFIDTGEIKIPNPGWKGFKGTVKQGSEKHKWIVNGKISIINSTTIDIVELPIGFNLKSYIGILNDLEDKNIITSYTDNCEGDIFNFRVRVSRKMTALPEDEILKELCLFGDPKSFSENYTVMGADNRIMVKESPEKLFEEYAKIRLDFYNKRKIFLIEDTTKKIMNLASKYFFIKAVSEDKIIINKKKKEEIILQIDRFENIKQEDGSYDYLLRMPLYALTKEKMEELKNEISELKNQLNEYKTKDEKKFWKEDLELLKTKL